jgi:hypothetical protein
MDAWPEESRSVSGVTLVVSKEMRITPEKPPLLVQSYQAA